MKEYQGGDLLEFYKARVASKNGETKWVDHWNAEAKNLIDRLFVAALLHRPRGFSDRRRARDELIASMLEVDDSYRRAATNIVKRDFGARKLRHPLTDEDMEAFWELVEGAAAPVLG